MRKASLNHVYRVVWSSASGCWVAVSEIAKSHCKKSSKVAGAVASALLVSSAAWAGAPTAVDLDAYFANATIFNGNGGTGCMIGVSAASCSQNPAASTPGPVTFTNYKTTGGTGSGGGAGFGGVFFVAAGSALTLNNVQFTGNAVAGGNGGVGTVGGTLNNITNTPIAILNGQNGSNADSSYASYNNGNGGPGYGGAAGLNGLASSGGNGGNGGNGSNGATSTTSYIINMALAAYNIAKAGMTTAQGAAYGALAAAAGGDPITMPLAAQFTALAAAAASDATSQGVLAAAQNLYNIALSVKAYEAGAYGNGGKGAAGGNGGNGSTYYGGGAGGNGGTGGNAAYDGGGGIGGAGAAGGAGGAGGFGAGGGSGGLGAVGGSSESGVNGATGQNGTAGAGGFGGGAGSSGTQSGGGGSGYGGAIFVAYDATTATGGNLNITGNALFRNNSAQAGSSNNGGVAGQAAGADLFIMRGASVTLAPGAGNTIRFEGGIADDSSASIQGASWAAGNGADVTVAGGGLVQFAAQNTYTGKTIVTGATLETQLGVGINNSSSILFAGQGSIGSLQPDTNAGVLLLNGEVTRLAGTNVPGQISWNGSGGFAADSTNGLVVNFGRTSSSSSSGQTLLWGSNYLTSNSTLVFGSEYGLGPVYWMNAINLQGNAGNVVVYNSQQVVNGQPVNSAAYMSGNISQGTLNVGSAGYNGTLYLTGQNTLTGITVNTGTVSTSDGMTTGHLFGSNGGYATVNNGGELQLQGSENVTAVTVNNGGTLLTKAGTTLSSSGDINNSGAMVFAGNLNTATVTNNATGNLVNTGTVTASGAVSNAGTWSQGFLTNGANTLQLANNANVTAASVTNNGSWGVMGTQSIATSSLTGNGTFVITNETGNTPVTSQLTVALSSNSTYAGSFAGNGVLNKTGAGTLNLTGANTNTGGTIVSAGTIDTAGGGTLSDTGALTILSGATFKANTADTVGAVSNTGTYDINTNQSVASLQNTVGGVSNLQANLTAAATVTNNGSVNVTGQRLLSTTGLAGSTSSAQLTVGTSSNTDSLSLNQSGNSTYAGQINGTGSFIKTGAGTLTLSGNAGAVNLGNQLVINAGTVSLTTANILASTMNVQVNSSTVGNVTTTGTLQLLTGNQSIAALGGAGAIDLENGNRLIVQNGGQFTGTVTGSGTLDIRSGSFTVNNHLNSTNASSVLSIGNNDGNIGATATVNSSDTLNYPTIALQNHGGLVVNGTVNATQTNLSANSLLEVQSNGTMTSQDLTLTSSSTANVLGKLNTSTITLDGSSNGSAILHLGNGQELNNGGTLGTVTANSTTITNGTLSGNGSLSGNVTFANGSLLSPGNSPGLLMLSGNVTLGNGSVSLMQVQGTAGSRVAGTDYDQVQVGGNLAIQNGASLQIAKLSGDELAQDEKLRLFSFGDGKVSGQFSSVTSSFNNQVIYDIATGTVIGMGASGYSGFLQRVATTNNEVAILSALNVNSTGGVKQFYGGYLLNRLADADLTGSTSNVFARFSPEAYAALSDQVRGAMFDSGPSLLDDISKGNLGGSVGAFYDTQSTSLGQQYAKYSMSTQGVRLGYSGELSSGTVGSISARVGDYTTSSDFLSGKATGVAVTLAVAHQLPSLSDGLYLFGRTGFAYQNNDMTRTTNLGTATANDVASQGAFAGLGMGYLTEFAGVRVHSSLEATSYRITVDGFSENNSQSLTDALNVNRQSQSGTALIFDLEGSGKLSDRFDYDAGITWTSFEQSEHTIGATVNTEVTPFSVSTPGVKQNQFSVNGGLSYRFDKGENIRLDVRSSFSNSTAVNLTYQNRF